MNAGSAQSMITNELFDYPKSSIKLLSHYFCSVLKSTHKGTRTYFHLIVLMLFVFLKSRWDLFSFLPQDMRQLFLSPQKSPFFLSELYFSSVFFFLSPLTTTRSTYKPAPPPDVTERGQVTGHYASCNKADGGRRSFLPSASD